MSPHLHSHLGHLADALIQSDLWKVHLSEERETTIYRCRYIKDVHRSKCQAPTIARLTPSPYTTKIARIRCYSMQSTIFKSNTSKQQEKGFLATSVAEVVNKQTKIPRRPHPCRGKWMWKYSTGHRKSSQTERGPEWSIYININSRSPFHISEPRIIKLFIVFE